MKAHFKKYLPALSIASTFVPLVTHAATQQTLKDIIGVIAGYLDLALKLLMGLAVVAFVWYVVKYFILQGNDTKRTEAGSYVMWSLIGFFIILSLWGLENILLSTFNLNNSNPASITNVQGLFPQ